MEFKKEELVDREIEIAGLLIHNVSLHQIAETTGLSKKLLTAHIKNMMVVHLLNWYYQKQKD